MGGYGYVHADVVPFHPGEVIFEAGAGPESTPYLERVAAITGTKFMSVDYAADGDAVAWLRATPAEPMIRFAYLDSYDWPYADMSNLVDQRRTYARMGLELSEDASAAHHLALAELVAQRAAPDATIVFDDTWSAEHVGVRWDGKGRDAVPWLLARGWVWLGGHYDRGRKSGRNAFYAVLAHT